MGRSRYQWSERKIQRWVKQGRGQGAGSHYLPWLRVSDVPSRGFSHRVWGEITGRIHHLLSYLEYQVYLWCLLFDGIIDIREAYPLNREDTRRIAKALGCVHPRYPQTSINTVMTTDLLLTRIVAGIVEYVALSVKPSSELANHRVVEKLLIERNYWLERGVHFYVMTERELPKVVLRNFDRIRFALNLSLHPDFSPEQARSLQRVLLDLFPQRKTVTYAEFCTEFDARLGLTSGDTHYLLTNLMGNGVVTFDMQREWDVGYQIRELHVCPNALDKLAQDGSAV
ncbi:TnsA endonuclease N-terminal domain-containing protein [Aromatoleum toluclasticum]|uniref:TnsA endonuclease N-terminal domain-containing protein n=1 Tax=Aromatoleum toluclasticum TaxID=92003 RepID=UPI000685A7E6|nr:TnsA endonuclease N-terminal domain-containing protein [Aromatoleum toluclasticum]